MTAESPKAAVVMAFNGAMFEQARRCIATIRTHCRHPIDLCVVAIDLAEAELAELRDGGARVFTDYRSLPCFADAPTYAYALTCRPYLRRLFPEHELYLWVDADIRFEHRDAFDFYLGEAAAEPRAIVVCHEVDPAFCFLQNAAQARMYHAAKYDRILRTYGHQAAEHLKYFHAYNGGIFAMHRDAPTWNSYRRVLEHAMKAPFDHMAEQDALNIAIMQDNLPIRVAPAIMNWLCSMCMPVFNTEAKRWVRPTYPHLPISVLHLTNSLTKITIDGQEMTYYEFYKREKFTA